MVNFVITEKKDKTETPGLPKRKASFELPSEFNESQDSLLNISTSKTRKSKLGKIGNIIVVSKKSENSSHSRSRSRS